MLWLTYVIWLAAGVFAFVFAGFVGLAGYTLGSVTTGLLLTGIKRGYRVYWEER